MRTLLVLSVVVALCGLSRAAEKADALGGKWEIVSLERDGKADDALKGAIRVHEGDKYTVTPKEGKAITGTFKLDAAAKPKTLDMMPGEGRYKGKTLLGIYELEGDTLKVAFAEPGKDRPTDFTPKAGVVVAVHKRLK
jgi:uncharacterized protein (TIGR03067 family)